MRAGANASDRSLPGTLRGALATALMLVIGNPVSAGTPDGCSDLSAVAPFTQFRYTQFQGIFDTLTDPKNQFSQLCTSCHPGSVGAGQLGLGDGFSYDNLVGVPSSGDPSYPRVDPGNAANSMLFLKINCDEPPPQFSARMPFGGSPMSPTQQAFFRDWINYGAPLSRLGFEDR